MVLPYLISSGFTSDFWFCYYYYYIICVYILAYHCTNLLFLLNYTMHVPCLISLTISACSCMHVITTRFSIHTPFIQIYRYTRACPCTPLSIHHTLVREFLTPLNSHVQIMELGACGFSRLSIRNAQL